MALPGLLTQVKALTKKNLRLLITRHWLSTLLQAVVAPILIIALTLNINNFAPTSQRYGVGEVRPVRSIKNSIADSQRLVFVKPPNLGPDVSNVIQTIASTLLPEQVVTVDDQEAAARTCPLTWRGVSDCYAVVVFKDSPQTRGFNQTWNYALRFDPARSYGDDSVYSDDGNRQKYIMPTQLAVENAITNSTEVPLAYSYTMTTQQEVDNSARISYGQMVITIYVIVFFLSLLPPIYHVVGVITRERDSGVAHLIDAMGGSPVARVLSHIVSFSIIYLPVWITMGCLYWALLLRESNAAIPIFWQIFTGLAMLTASIFAASFFSRRHISSIFTCIAFTCLAGGAAILINRKVGTGTVIALSLFFPSMNYIFSLSHMAVFALGLLPVDMGTSAVEYVIKPEENPFLYLQTYFVPVRTFWILLIVQIIVYPLLAILVERHYHGISFKSRQLSPTTADISTPAVQTMGLGKVYYPSWYKRLFGKREGFTALDGVDLVAEKNQILCLLGVNGAGKSTTLDLLSGFRSPTSGEILINAGHSQLGICPQKNVLFDRLTVLEHVKFWSEIKGDKAEIRALHALIEACDLSLKTYSRASTLSGGQKRKLQLACMFAGGTTVCLMDEVTTGLDPISRRTIWNIILAERAKRSMIFTTHFLDEGEVLADHIIILSKGKIKCQGTGTELKNRFGGGYRVHIPKDAYVAGVDAPRTVHQDRVIYRTPDSKSAAALVAQIEVAGCSEAQIAGPTIEDVFLGVAEDDISTDSASSETEAGKMASISQLSSGTYTSFWRQVRALLKKRIQVLPRYWPSAFLALALPIACMPGLNELVGKDFRRPNCEVSEIGIYEEPVHIYAQWSNYLDQASYFGDGFPFGPASANESLHKVMESYPIAGESFNISLYGDYFNIISNFGDLQKAVRARKSYYANGGLWVGDKEQPPTMALQADAWSPTTTMEVLNLYTSVTKQVPISLNIQRIWQMGLVGSESGGWMYILYSAIIMAVYPAFFALYPAFEKSTNVRAVQYSNGVRALPLWTSYFLFDLVFVLAVSIAYTVTISIQYPYWWGASYMFPVCLFYGIISIFIAYMISTKASSQLASFLWTLGCNVFGYLIMALATTLPQLFSDPLAAERNNDIIAYVLGLFFPIASVFRGMAAGLNQFRLACRDDGSILSPGSWWGYGFPITYLVIQMIVFGALLVWIDSDLSFSLLLGGITHKDSNHVRHSSSSIELASHAASGSLDNTTINPVEKEAARVKQSRADLLRLVNVTKSFNPRTTAVNNVSLGLGEGEILALLGPNGAGKTTMVNLIRGELRPNSGSIYLRDVDVLSQPHEAQKSIGVCPQFDALDLLTVRQHLEFYANIKGVKDVKGNVETLMARVGLSEFAKRQASKLSGGNKRKLSLAIALMGNPDVLILDEPSSSMDAAAKRRMWKLLEEVAAPGRSLLLTTHSMEEADHLATRAAILSKKLLAIGTTQQLRNEYSNLYSVQLVLKTAPHSGMGEMKKVEDWVKGVFGAENVNFEGQSLGGQVKFMVPVDVGARAGIEKANGLETGKKERRGVGYFIELLEQNREELGLADYSVGAPTLERVFLSVVKDHFVHEDEEREMRRAGRKRCLWNVRC
ncbi:putative ABC transporter [Naviculisporaceae sp. PSN 640]